MTLYSRTERQHQAASSTSTLVLLTEQQHNNYDHWYYVGTAINPRSGLPVRLSGIRGPANALAEPTPTRRQAYIQRTGRSSWEIVQLLPFTQDEHERVPSTYVNIWY